MHRQVFLRGYSRYLEEQKSKSVTQQPINLAALLRPRLTNLKATGGKITNLSHYIDWTPRGTDTVPIMGSPGEFIVNRKMTEIFRHELELMNKGVDPWQPRRYKDGGFVPQVLGMGRNVAGPKYNVPLMANQTNNQNQNTNSHTVFNINVNGNPHNENIARKIGREMNREMKRGNLKWGSNG
jgi:hypothetical protein